MRFTFLVSADISVNNFRLANFLGFEGSLSFWVHGVFAVVKIFKVFFVMTII